MNPLEVSAGTNRWASVPVGEKLVFYLGALLCAMVLPPRTGAPLVLAVVLVATLVLARVDRRLFVLALAGPAVFIALGSIPIAVGIHGGLHLESAGVTLAVDTSLRAIAATAATIGLASTTAMSDLLDLARRMGMSPALCHVTDLTYRLVGILFAAALTARESIDLRLGLHDRRRAMAAVGGQFALVFVRAMERARAMSEAMSLRAEPGQTAVLTDTRPMRPSRIAASVVVLAAVAAAALLLRGIIDGT